MTKIDEDKIVKKIESNLISGITREYETAESYNTGLLGEKLIVASLKTMTLSNLKKVRVILNGIIKQKVEYRRVEENKNKVS